MFVMKLSAFEFNLKEIFNLLLEKYAYNSKSRLLMFLFVRKLDRWAKYKKESSGRMQELSEYFSGTSQNRDHE